MSNISSIAGPGSLTGTLIDKKSGLAQGGDLPTGPFEDDEQRLIHQHKRSAKDPTSTRGTTGGRKAARRLIRL